MQALKISLLRQTPPSWTELILSRFDEFIVNHAACERKASSTGINFVVQYPDRKFLIEPMIRLAKEELQHFHQVSRLMLERNLTFKADEKDPYINGLIKCQRNGSEQRLLDRLLIFGIAEARGCERFGLVGRALPEGTLKTFYQQLADAEERHHEIFIEMASHYFNRNEIEHRLNDLLMEEAKLFDSLPHRAAVH